MKTTMQACFILLMVGSVAAAELPEITESTKVIGPPDFRSYKLTKIVKRGKTEILQDIHQGPSKDAALRSQQVIYDGQCVYSIRETKDDTIVSSTHGNTVSVLQIDVDRNGKPDLLLLLAGGRTAEAYMFGKDGFVSPCPADMFFNESGTKRHHEIVVQSVRKRISRQKNPPDNN